MSTTIKGINVKVGYETTGLAAALKDVNSKSRSISTELRKVENLLKFNPKDTELLAQKQKLLADRVETTKEKLDRLKSVQGQIKKQFQSGEIDDGQYRAFQRELIKTKSQLDTFEKQVKSASKENNKFAESLSKAKSQLKSAAKVAAAGMATAITAVSAAAVKATKDTMEYTDRIDKLSQRLGLSREGFQEWEFVLSQSGTTMESLQSGMKVMVQRMDDLQKGTGIGTEAFKKLGIQWGDIRDLSQEDVFALVVKRFNDMEDGAEKAALAQDIFSRSGQELLPLLNSEAGTVEELTKKARDLGLVLNDEVIDAGVELTDTYDQLKRAINGLKLQIGTELMPTMQDWSDYTLDNMPEIREKVSDIVDAVKKVALGFKLVYDVGELAFEGVADVIVGVVESTEMVAKGIETLYFGLKVNTLETQLTIAKMIDAVLGQFERLSKVPKIGDDFKFIADSSEDMVNRVQKNLDQARSDLKGAGSDWQFSLLKTQIAWGDLGKNVSDNVKGLIEDFYKLLNANKDTQEEIRKENNKTEEINEETNDSIKDDNDTTQEEITGKTLAEMDKRELALRNHMFNMRKIRSGELDKVIPLVKEETGKTLEEMSKRENAERNHRLNILRERQGEFDDFSGLEEMSTGKLIEEMSKREIAMRSYMLKKRAERNGDNEDLSQYEEQSTGKTIEEMDKREAAYRAYLLRIRKERRGDYDDEVQVVQEKTKQAVSAYSIMKENIVQIMKNLKENTKEASEAMSAAIVGFTDNVSSALYQNAEAEAEYKDKIAGIREEYKQQLSDLEKKRREELEAVKGNIDKKTEINKKYDELRAETVQNEKEGLKAVKEAYESNKKSIKDILKEMVLNIVTALEQEVIARQIAGVAESWGAAPITFGASLAWIPEILAAVGPALAGFEAVKVAIRGLETGGVVTGGSNQIFRLGDGVDDEAALPLNKSVYRRIGQGIVENLSDRRVIDVTPVKENHIHIHGIVVADELGLKKLERRLRKVRISENQRLGN